MSDLLKNQLIRNVIKLNRDRIIDGLDNVFQQLISKKNEFTLEEGEIDIVALVYEKHDRVLLAICAINDESQITRYLLVKEVREYINQALENF